jgi:acyl-CoA hydrolase
MGGLSDSSIDDALSRILRPGQDIVVGQAWGTPRALVEALPGHLDLLEGSRIFFGMLVDEVPVLPGVAVETFFPSGPLGTEAGLELHGATYTRGSLFEIAAAFRTGARPVDVVLAQASRARGGACSLGVTIDFAHAAAASAEHVVLESGAGVPWTGPQTTIDSDRAVALDVSSSPLTLRRSVSRSEEGVAANVAAWIPDGSTLQLGMAGWLDPLAAMLRERRGLRVHTGLVSDWILTLDSAGALDGTAIVTATGAAGTAEFYSWLDGAGRAHLAPADVTHSPETLRSLPLLRAVNSVFEVDLHGNANCERTAGGRRGGVAGLQDFASAAASADDGLSIIALSSTARDRSRIVPALPADAVSLPGQHVDLVVTEHGTADLRGRSPEERARALAAVAAPGHRAGLAAGGG